MSINKLVKEDLDFKLNGKQDNPVYEDFYDYLEHSKFRTRRGNELMRSGKQPEQDYKEWIQQSDISPMVVKTMYGWVYPDTLGNTNVKVPNPRNARRMKGLVQIGNASYTQDLNEYQTIYPE